MGTESGIVGNTSNALALYGGSNDVTIWAGGAGNQATITSTGINNTVIGATTPAAGTFTTLTVNGKAVSEGAADSGGVGFKLLRVPN